MHQHKSYQPVFICLYFFLSGQAAILYNLKARHVASHPYTRTGDIVLAVNPYQWFHDIYSYQVQEYYANMLVWNAGDVASSKSKDETKDGDDNDDGKEINRLRLPKPSGTTTSTSTTADFRDRILRPQRCTRHRA